MEGRKNEKRSPEESGEGKPRTREENYEAWAAWLNSHNQEEIDTMDFKKLFGMFCKFQPMPIK